MTKLSLFVRCPLGTHSPEQNYSRTKALFARFSEISPLFARISPRATRSGWINMEAQPWFPDITFDEWKAAYAAHDKAAKRYGDAPHLGVMLPYWNRMRDSRFQKIVLDYDVTDDCRENGVMLNNMATELVEGDLTPALMQACIEVFDAPRAESAWHAVGQDPHFLYHRLWLKEGMPFPKGKARPQPDQPIRREPIDRYPLGHPSPARSEPWLGGILYTWPEHDPIRLMKECAETPVAD